MSSVDLKIKAWETKYKQLIGQFQMWDQSFVIIPYQPSGYIDYSNFGYVDGQTQISQFETYKRLWTGNDAFIIQWKNSITFNNDDNPNYDYVDKITLNYSVGEAMLGWMNANITNNEISTDTSFSEYKSQKSITSITLRVPSFYELDDNYSYYFYKVPECAGQTLFKVDSIEKEFIGKDLMCYLITLTSLQDELANTGRAKDQNVMPSAPGQGYLRPLIQKTSDVDLTNLVENKDYLRLPDPNRIITIDNTYVQNNPVKSVVIKMFGFGVLSNIIFIGRRAQLRGNFRDYGIPRLIFPMNFQPADTPTLYRTQQEETNFYWCYNFAPTLNFSASIFEKIKGFLDFATFYDMQGYMKVNEKTTKATNPIITQDDGSEPIYGYQLFGQKVADGSFKKWIITPDSEKTYNTSFTLGCAQSYTIKKEERAVHDLMWDAYWIQKSMKTLPLTLQNTLNFGWTVGAGYAALVSKNIFSAVGLFLIGILGSVIVNSPTPKFQTFMGLIPCGMFDFMTQESQQTLSQKVNDKNIIRLNYFLNSDSDNDAKAFYNTKTMNTSFRAELTDTFTKDGKTYTTDLIGQKVDANGNNIFSDGSLLLMSGGEKLQSINDTNPNEGWIIDSFNVQAIFSGDLSIEFLDINGDVIWYGVYQSEAKWTGSIREINTWKDTSIFNSENRYLGKPLKWPQSLQVLDPQYSVPSIQVNQVANMQDMVISTYGQQRESFFYNKRNDDKKLYYNNVDGSRLIELGYYDKLTYDRNAIISDAFATLSGGEKQKKTGKIIVSNQGFLSLSSFLDFFRKSEIIIRYSLFVNDFEVNPNNYSASIQDDWETSTFTDIKWTSSSTLDNGAEVTEWEEVTLYDSLSKEMIFDYSKPYSGPQLGIKPIFDYYAVDNAGITALFSVKKIRGFFNTGVSGVDGKQIGVKDEVIAPKLLYHRLNLRTADTIRMRLRNESGVIMLEWEFQPKTLEFYPDFRQNAVPETYKDVERKIYLAGYMDMAENVYNGNPGLGLAVWKLKDIKTFSFSTCKSVKLTSIKFTT